MSIQGINSISRGFCSLLFLLTGCIANATTTLIHDSLDGSPADALEGRIPDKADKSAVWTAAAGFQADGSYSVVANSSAWLPMKIEKGKRYRLSADVSIRSADTETHWAGIGFGTDNLFVFNTLTQATRGVACLTLRYDGRVNAYVDGSVLVGSDVNTSAEWGTASLAIVLQTHADDTPWTVDFYIENRHVWSHAIASDMAITRAVISSGRPGGNSGGFKNVQLTSSNSEKSNNKLTGQ